MRILIDGQTLATPDIDRGIGRVFLGLCRNMIVRDQSHQWMISVPAGCDPTRLGPEVLRRAELFEVPEIDLASGYETATSRHRSALEKICQEERGDLYWCPNPMMSNVVLPIGLTGPRVVCTLYDIIPARLPETHQATWSPSVRAEYAQRLARIVDWADRLVFISQAAADDFTRFAPLAAKKSSAIQLGIEHGLFWPSAAIESPPLPNYLLMVAGADPRKNTARAIEAFALLCKNRESNQDHISLKIVGGYDPASRRTLEQVADAHHIADRVHFLGHVSDAALARLYREATALLFPSLYEGFGLPVVEALASGTPAVVSDRDELREAAGRHGILCDPTDAASIACKLGEVLDKPWSARGARLAAIEWAHRFTWERAADAYGAAFSEVVDENPKRIKILERPRVAWASPWPPMRSGISDYSLEVVGRLRERMDIEIFAESIDGSVTSTELPLHSIDDLPRMRDRFDITIYHLGNNADHHRKLYKAAWEFPGITVLHDFNIHPFLHSAYLGTPDEVLYRAALSESHGATGLHHFERVKARMEHPAIWDFPASNAIAERSLATIVHSSWVCTQLREGGARNVSVVPHGADVRQSDSKGDPDARLRMGLRPDHFVIGVFGFLNRHKRIPSVIATCKRLRDAGYPVTLLIVGEPADGQFDLDVELDRCDARGFTKVTGYVDDKTYWAYLDVTDVVINLRYPSMGESSGSLMRGLGSGASCIVSDYAQFADIPDSVCWKVSTGDTEIDELTACLAELLREPELRASLGQNAREYVASRSSFDYAAGLYEQIIHSVNLVQQSRKFEARL